MREAERKSMHFYEKNLIVSVVMFLIVVPYGLVGDSHSQYSFHFCQFTFHLYFLG
jgi:hypothetical protein